MAESSGLRARSYYGGGGVTTPASDTVPNRDTREYDIILLGATGYTGRLTCEYLLGGPPSLRNHHHRRHQQQTATPPPPPPPPSPTPLPHLRIALAGRSLTKLNDLLTSLLTKFPNANTTHSLSILPTPFSEESVAKLSLKTKVLATTVGPFSLHGEAVLAACARNGTHYVDCTGEHPWVRKMIDRYGAVARTTGAILVPQCAIESAVPDWVVYELVRFMKEELAGKAKDVKLTVQFIGGAPSGGTLETSMIMTECHSLLDLYKASQPYGLCDLPPNHPITAREPPDVTVDPELGPLTPWLMGAADRAILMRSWSLFQQAKKAAHKENDEQSVGNDYYADDFMYKEYMQAPSYIAAWGMKLVLAMVILVTLFPPVKWVMRRVMTKPGGGPTEEKRINATVIYRAVGDLASSLDKTGKDKAKRAKAVLEFKGDAYTLSGLCIAEAAITLAIEDGKTVASQLGGGVVTPATVATEGHLGRIREKGFVVRCGVV